MSGVDDVLLANFYLSAPVLRAAILDELLSLIRTHAPSWSTRLFAARGEERKRAVLVPPDELAAGAITGIAGIRHGLGRVVLFGADDSLLLLLSHANSTLPPEANLLTVEVSRQTVDGSEAALWVRALFRDLISRLPIRYAKAHLASEFDAKNMLTEGGTTRAVGMNLQAALPGLYWLNFFGEPYIELGLRVPATEGVEKISSGVLIELGSNPAAWNTPEYRDLDQSLRVRLGERFFFDRGLPLKPLDAPRFRPS